MACISVIIPVYNAGKKIEKTIKSVMNQTFFDFELILINDGSTDSSVGVCEKYKTIDNRVKLVHQKNQGLCYARNIGIEKAIGEYIVFLDHDDEYNIDLLENNYILAKKYSADVVKFSYEYINVKNGKRKVIKAISKLNKIEVVEDQHLKEKYKILCENKILTYIWDGMYKREFIIKNNLKFDTRYTIGIEDTDFSISMYPYLERLIYNPKVFYKYYIYSNSTYNDLNINKIKKYINDLIYLLKKEIVLLDSLQIKRDDSNYFEYRKWRKILDAIAYIWERRDLMSINEMTSHIKEIKFILLKENINLGKINNLKFQHKIIALLFDREKFYTIALLLKVFIK